MMGKTGIYWYINHTTNYCLCSWYYWAEVREMVPADWHQVFPESHILQF